MDQSITKENQLNLVILNHLLTALRSIILREQSAPSFVYPEATAIRRHCRSPLLNRPSDIR